MMEASMEVRRRTGEFVKSDESKAETKSVDPKTKEDSSLVEDGKELFEKAVGSGYKNLESLAMGLKKFIEAAANGSRDGADQIKSFLVTTSQDRLAFVLDSLPNDLLSAANVLVKGSETEKQVYKVAKDMFRTMARGKKEISEDEIDEAAMRLLSAEATVVGVEEVKAVTNLKGSVRRLLKFAKRTSQDGKEVITEEAFCLVACQYARGELVFPLEADDYYLSPERYKEFLEANWLKKATEFPIQTASYLGQYGLKTVEKYGVRWIWSFIPTRQLYLLALVYFLPLVKLSIVLSFLATLVFFCSFLTMVVATLQIVANWRRVAWFLEYSTIFRYFSEHGSAINTKDPETRLLRNTAVPYISFSVGTVVTVFSITLAYKIILVYESLFLLSSVMTLFVFVRFKCWKSPLIVGSVCARLLSWSLAVLFLISDWIPVPEFLFGIFGNQIFSIPIFPGISFAVNLVTLVQVPMQVCLLLYLFVRSSLRDSALSVGNYVLFMSWWIFSRHLFVNCSVEYLVLFLPSVFLLIFLTPLLPLAFLVTPFVFLWYSGLSMEFLIALTMVVFLGIASLLVILNYKRLLKAKWLNIRIEYLFLIQLIVCIPTLYIGARYYSSIYSPAKLPLVTVAQYNAILDKYLTTDNSIQSQIDCLHLEGRVLTGNAQVESVSIGGVLNKYVSMVGKLPVAMHLPMTCLMGETNPSCGLASDSPTCLYKGCHFDSSNQYIINITAFIGTCYDFDDQKDACDKQRTQRVKLNTIVPHKDILNSSLLLLKKNAIIKFNATLVSGAGSHNNVMLLLKAFVYKDERNQTHTYSSSKESEDINEAKQEVFSLLVHSFKRVVSFFLDTFFGYSFPNYFRD